MIWVDQRHQYRHQEPSARHLHTNLYTKPRRCILCWPTRVCRRVSSLAKASTSSGSFTTCGVHTCSCHADAKTSWLHFKAQC